MGSAGDGHTSERVTDRSSMPTGLETADWVDAAPPDAGTNRKTRFVCCSMARVGHAPSL